MDSFFGLFRFEREFSSSESSNAGLEEVVACFMTGLGLLKLNLSVDMTLSTPLLGDEPRDLRVGG